MAQITKIPRWKWFYMFMMFMWIGRASPYTGFNINENPIMPIYLCIIGYYYLRFCRKPLKPLIVLLSILGVWSLISYIKYDGLYDYSFQFIYYLIIAHVAFNIFNKEEYLYLFEEVLVALCSLSLIVWASINIFPSVALPVMDSVSIYKGNGGTLESSSIVVGVATSFEMGIRRNLGFTWEPGIFSCFVALGLYVNLIRNRFKLYPIKSNRNFYILMITMLSTLSTTGYMLIFVILLFYILNKSVKGKVMALILTACFIPTIAGLSFMYDKISTLMDVESEFSSMNYYIDNGAGKVTPQRFGGFYFEWLNFLHDFWFGYGHSAQSYTSTVLFNKVNVAVSCGILGVFAKYGVFVGLFFYYWMIKSSVFLSKNLQYNGKYIFALLFTTMGFSYDFWENNILIFFYLSSFYVICSNSYAVKWKFKS